MGARLQVPAGMKVPFDPWSVLGCLGAALLQELQYVRRQHRRLTTGQNREESALQLFRRGIAQDRDVPDIVEDQPVGR